MVNQADCPCCGEGAFYELQVYNHPNVIEPAKNLVFTCPNNCQDNPGNFAAFYKFITFITAEGDASA